METEVSIDEGVGEGNREERRPRLLRAEGSVLSEEFIEGLERQADATAQQLALHISSLHASLHAMQTFKMSADNTTAAVSTAVAQMHGFLTKCQQLNQDLPPIDDLAKQIKDLRRTLDLFEMLTLRFGRT
ncbi:uncharacterized protein ACA1_232470 [Acanthamoeba castellanii str. Neff]|uniref:BLOC-1-related complex subunit 6 C-terminal helix domain-containing protein n=1 Tax=Acanthamoeba castellanii (strain ATCC 30010 / Neff) TaxID=1257118 RepID=L8H3B5_ACACF|nr:uncharacterized protein ACA1_232470 [Acanthamoeba castellanii str. Neff]ELR18911.1 hypothetical protein ACA1_232470 [Acanthamoeba castellanii str. Neff]